VDHDGTPGNIDTVLLGLDVQTTDLTLTRDGGDLYISINGTDDRLQLSGWYSDEAHQIERVQFTDGTVWNAAYMAEMARVGTDSDDFLVGTPGNDLMDGQGGNDEIYGLEGDDILYGGSGDDRIYGAAGNDTLYGGSGRDYLDGGTGNDTYIFARGSGEVTVVDYDNAQGNLDTVLFGADVQPSDITLTRSGDDLLMSVNDSSDAMLLTGWFTGDAWKIERVQFNDGTVWDAPYLRQVADAPTDEDDYIEGTPGDDVIDGQGGNDIIYGLAGDDQLFGGNGQDTIYGGGGDDTISGGLEDDQIVGGPGCNVIDGGPGSDRIITDQGQNTITVNRGGGFDEIISRFISEPDQPDTIVFGPGIKLEDLKVQMKVDGLEGYTNVRLALGIGEEEGALISASSTRMVKDICPGWDDGGIHQLTNVNGIAFFTASDGIHGYELWESDGTDTGTVMVKDIFPGSTGGGGGGGPILCMVNSFDSGYPNSSEPDYLTNVSGTLFFMANDGVHGLELWKSDGTEPGTMLVKDINPGEGSSGDAYESSNLTDVNGTLFFTANDGLYGLELWKSDGTEAGTVMVKDINPNYYYPGAPMGSYARDLINVNGTLFFTAYDGVHGIALWKSDGTEAGTSMVKELDFYVGETAVQTLANVNGTLFLRASDGSHGYELWKSDGTEAGTVMVKDINPGERGSYSQNFTVVGDNLFFLAQNESYSWGLWRTDGTETGTVKLNVNQPALLTEVNGTLFFIAQDDAHGFELWKSDGTQTGTVLVKDIWPGPSNGGVGNLTNVAGTLFFTAYGDSDQGIELWKSDGTEAGTVMVCDTYPGNGGGFPADLTNIDDTLFFTAEDGVHGRELWKSEGSPRSTPSDLAVKRFVFADGTVLTLEDMLAHAVADGGVIGDQEGTDADDVLRGSVTSDSIDGLGGNDKIEALDQDDLVWGGEGDDIISAGSGNDGLSGGQGNDVMAGGHGDDWLEGSNGSDVYSFNRGDGKDYIYDSPGWSEGEDPQPLDVDTLSFGVSINPQDIAGYIEYSELVLKVQGGTDEIRLYLDFDYDTGELLGSAASHVQFIDTAGNARVFDLSGIIQALRPDLEAGSVDNAIALFTDSTQQFELTGTVGMVGGDNAVAYAQTGDLFGMPTHLEGTSGDDVITAQAGDDTINTGEGNDTIIAGAGNDVIDAGTGNDTIIAGMGNDVINAGDGTDRIEAGSGDDVIQGLHGGDTAIGGTGNDTYYFNLGDGRVSIEDLAGLGEGNIIVFGADIILDSLTLIPNGDALILRVGDAGDEISLKAFDQSDVYGEHAADTFRFADGTTVSWAELLGKGFDITGSEGDDILTGTSATDRIVGLGGDDILAGGAGNNILDGGSGYDTYAFNLGDGVDTILDAQAQGAENSVEFGMGTSFYDLTLSVDGSALLIKVGSEGDALRLEGFDPNDPYNTIAIGTFKFEDGTVLSSAELLNLGFTLEGTPGDDILRGTPTRDLFIAHEGNDQLIGASGDDTYLYNVGDGVDTIIDESTPTTPNLLVFGSGITPEGIKLSHDPENGMLILNVGTDGGKARFTNFNAADPYGPHAVECYLFADGQILTYSQLIDKGFDIIGTPGDETLTGTAATDRITGGDGNDTLSGAGGNDTLVGGREMIRTYSTKETG